MSEPITPKYYADEVVLQTLGIEFNQTWDGAAWVIDPTTISLVCTGNLADSGTSSTIANLRIFASDLPAAGQTALQDLFNYLEDEMAAKYS